MIRRHLALAILLVAAAPLAACDGTGATSGPSLTMPTPATHARFFPIDVGDVHGPRAGQATVDCNACHRDRLTDAPSQSFRTFACMGCHDAATPALHNDPVGLAALHQASLAVSDMTARTGQPFDVQDTACRACHPQGIRDGMDHATHFPLPHGDAAGTVVARCAECHVSTAVPRQYRVFGCAGCHPHDLAATTALHAAVADYQPLPAAPTAAEVQAASARCIRCHGDGPAPVKVAQHAARANGFQVGGAAVHTAANAGCLGCHTALRTDPGNPLAADFTVANCVACHVTVGPGAGGPTHDTRTELQTMHASLTTAPKALLFAQTVDAATTAAGGDAARGLSAACLQCHPQGIGPHPYYLLPHRNAAGTVVAACEQCHVNPARKADLGCAACHATASPVGPKHARVPDVAPADTSLAASALCARCHEFDAIPVRVATGHTKFSIAAGAHSGAAGGRCLACHTALKGEPTPWAADWKRTGCTGCHVAVGGGRAQHDDAGLAAGQVTLAALHAGVSDFATTVAASGLSAACRTCHPSGVAGPPANHGEYFSLAAGGKHAYPGPRITACLDCHTSSNRLDPAAFRCAACHAADAVPLATGHAKVPDFAADPQNPVKCLACHADGRLPATSAGATVTVTSHATASLGFIIGSGSHAGAAGGACLACHPVNRSPTTAAPHWDYARDFKQVTCVGCHVTVGGGRAQHDDKNLTAGQVTLATLHAGVATFASTVAAKGLSAACLACHADGAGGAPANHPALFPIAAGTPHAGIACNACHTNPANRKDLAAFACASCHAGLPITATNPKAWSAVHAVTGYTITTYLTATTAGGTRTTVTVSLTDSRTCLRCHADGQVNRAATHPGGDAGFGQGDHRRAGCLTCHWQYRTDKTWGANFKSRTGSAGPPPTSCYVCHRTGSG